MLRRVGSKFVQRETDVLNAGSINENRWPIRCYPVAGSEQIQMRGDQLAKLPASPVFAD
jgi:hypothetical protein